MKKYRLTLLYLVFCICCFSQNRKYHQDDLAYILCVEEPYLKTVAKESEFPEFIKNSTNKIKKQIKLNNLKFKEGYINDLKGFFKKYPYKKNSCCGQIPSYFLIFNWEDLKLGIEHYEICMLFDTYGQLIIVNYPLDYLKKEIQCNSLDFALQKAVSLIKLDSIVFDDPYIDLKYLRSENDLVWRFTYYSADKEINIMKIVSVIFTSDKCNIEELETFIYDLKEDIDLEEEEIQVLKEFEKLK